MKLFSGEGRGLCVPGLVVARHLEDEGGQKSGGEEVRDSLQMVLGMMQLYM